MKITHVYFRPDGIICAVTGEMPVEPQLCLNCKGKSFYQLKIEEHGTCYSNALEYQQAIESIKSSAVKFENVDEAMYFLRASQRGGISHPIEPDTFYAIDLEVEIMLQVRHGVEWHDLPGQTEGRETDGIYQKVARIITEKKEPEPDVLPSQEQIDSGKMVDGMLVITTKPEPVGESQEDTWGEAQLAIKTKLGTYSNDLVCDLARWAIEALKEGGFNLTRKEK